MIKCQVKICKQTSQLRAVDHVSYTNCSPYRVTLKYDVFHLLPGVLEGLETLDFLEDPKNTKKDVDGNWREQYYIKYLKRQPCLTFVIITIIIVSHTREPFSPGYPTAPWSPCQQQQQQQQPITVDSSSFYLANINISTIITRILQLLLQQLITLLII